MLMQNLTHKNNKITTLTTLDSYKQLFVLIAMLLTALHIQPISTFTMAAPLESHHYHHHFRTHQQQPQQQQQYSQLHEILLAGRHRYDYDNYINHNRQYQHSRDYNNNNHHHHYRHRHHHQQELKTDLTRNEKKSKSMASVGDEDERLHKREISWHDYYNSIMQSQAINWYNPCGGYSKMNEIPVRRKRLPPKKKELRKLQNTIAKNYNLIRDTLHIINIQDMNQLAYFEKKYNFLPKLNSNSSISLRRWHRQLQVYVAAFEYLRRAELHFNNMKASQESSIAHELNELMKDARIILCNLEHAINNTTTHKGSPHIDSLFVSRTKMEEILNFTTDIKYVSPLRWHQMKDDLATKLVNPIDLKFAKSHYYGFVRKLLKILRMHTKRSGPLYLGKKANKKILEERQQKQQPQRQLKQERKRQHRLEQKKRKNHYVAKIRHSEKNSNQY